MLAILSVWRVAQRTKRKRQWVYLLWAISVKTVCHSVTLENSNEEKKGEKKSGGLIDFGQMCKILGQVFGCHRVDQLLVWQWQQVIPVNDSPGESIVI